MFSSHVKYGTHLTQEISSTYQRWICVCYCGGQVQHATHWDRIAESARVGADEGWPRMGKTGSTAEGEFERLLKMEAAENHRLMKVAVLVMVSA